MFPALITLALLTITDPAGGPAAAATLTPPTSALYRNLAPFDLQELTVVDSEVLEFRLRLGSYANPLDLPNGFSHPIIEVYIGGGDSGLTSLLPGSGLVLPDGEAWNYAFQLTGDHLRAFRATAAGPVELDAELQLIDEHLYVLTAEPALTEPRVAAITGLYSPFHETGWRPLEPVASPWAFSGDQRFPVIDVLALSEEAQLAALSGGVLPVTEVSTIENPNTVWFALMATGIGIAAVGLVLRGFSRSTQVVTPDPDDPFESYGQPGPAAEAPLAARTLTEAELDFSVPGAEAVPLITVPVAGSAASLAVADKETAAAEPEPAAYEPEDEEALMPRVGLFRGSPQAGHVPAAPALKLEEPEELPAAPVSESADDGIHALPDYGDVDFSGALSLEVTTEEPESAAQSEDAQDRPET